MFCTNCGSIAVDGARFCDKCGASLSGSREIFITRLKEEVNRRALKNARRSYLFGIVSCPFAAVVASFVFLLIFGFLERLFGVNLLSGKRLWIVGVFFALSVPALISETKRKKAEFIRQEYDQLKEASDQQLAVRYDELRMNNKKKRKGIWVFLCFVFILFISPFAYLKIVYKTTAPCVALSRAVGEEMPGTLDDLGKKYPLKVGIIRRVAKLLGTDKMIEELTQQVVTETFAEGISSGDLNPILLPPMCFVGLALGDFNRNIVRAGLVTLLEDKLRLWGSEIVLTNRCRETIRVSMLYMNKAGDWINVGWTVVEPNTTKKTDVLTKSSEIYLYAISNSNRYRWEGKEGDPDTVKRYVSVKPYSDSETNPLKDENKKLVGFFKAEPETTLTCGIS